MPVDTLTDQLLDPEEASPDQRSATWSIGRKKTVSAIALGLLFTAGFVGYTGQPGFGQVEPQTTSSRASTSPKATDLAVVSFKASCYAFTGGTCVVKPCNTERNATCQTGKCICAMGSCAGADGVCSKGNYELVEGVSEADQKPIKLTFANVYWPAYTMYMPKFTMVGFGDKIQVERSQRTSGANAWYLYKLPGYQSGKKQYLLANAYYENYVASRSPATVGIHGGFYAYNLDSPTVPYDPAGLTVYVCSLAMQGYPNTVMIGSVGALGKVHWAYIDSFSWDVKSTTVADDPGTGGYWKVDHELSGLDDC